MLKATGYEDMGVVKKFTEGSHLVGPCNVTCLWPKKFAPAAKTIDELHSTAAKERELHSHLHTGVGEVEVQQPAWLQTLKEVDNGAFVCPSNLDDVDATFPVSRRFRVRQGQKVRCVDDVTGSQVKAWLALIRWISGLPSKEQWKSRFFEGAYRQCAVNLMPAPFAHIAVFDPRTSTTFAFRMKALPFGLCTPFSVSPTAFGPSL